MQLSNLFYYVLATAAAVSAIPTPLDARSPPTDIPSTIHGFPPKDWVCKTSQTKDTTRKFSADYIKQSTEAGLRLRDNGNNPAGGSKYPQFFTNPESISGLEDYKGQTNVDHFPLNYDDSTVFTGGSPTSDARVVYQHTIESDEATFIGVWTHAGRKDGKFEKCTEQ
ncbi:hypothetical protein P153DRAFT_353510 [Dothidotthia symphoricarpi CBS 119687]|uniref:ribonuclease T1 n=1 Tax=Dothidotthia symphoricarpi CBS 119687 TaxID=1392245 RepID=A0A6A6AM83_9PLEO|nr:uncharacterized protein P153DRAFT_353510 [Dothidotthia symphoricarpi CBS 119687]KAF2133092.1 hypothetical protein P153DRAFT_353510 [Dothidotthia symphoricarpi CBS 119687]